MRGYSTGRKLDKLGMRGSHTGELVFRDCEVPAENVLGEVNGGVRVLMSGLDYERVVLAGGSLGLLAASLDLVLPYIRERKQFGQPISKFQAIQFKLADMDTEIELARLMYYKAAWLHMQGQPYTREASMAKLFASETAKRAADQAVQIHGGYGFMDEFPVSRYWRSVKINEIGEGTSEVQRMVIAKLLGC